MLIKKAPLNGDGSETVLIRIGTETEVKLRKDVCNQTGVRLMDEHAYENWTQDRCAGLDISLGQRHGLSRLLKLAREERQSLRADLDDIKAARAAADRSLEACLQQGEAGLERQTALRRLLNSLDRSGDAIREKLAVVQGEAIRLDGLISPNGGSHVVPLQQAVRKTA
ncbi:hypothetical protein PUV54_10485 [Hyphococcus flavus]|uniref:Uncharacterized protein n=1 Tax=Hyphococcus flavus TaxID=1866326 RepID=A0AAE9ZA49_9PROT|nr:hypothetical protein [Hyphococcus flavus]WDI30384.1 hypothetical protein PUV54_10485 [Hyphococcus flavus]